MSVNFKLTQRDGHIRRITFPGLPTWTALSEKIHSLYSIPVDKVAVSYIDNDSDEVTLSTNEELQDYYSATYRSGDIVKFTVQDLSATRVQDKSLPQTPRTINRNTFGHDIGLPFDIDEDWQVPNFFPDDGAPHAFVEVVPSDASSVSSHHESATSDSHSTVSGAENLAPRVDKGKGKAVEPFSSTASLLAEKQSSKPEVHVLDHSGMSDTPVNTLFNRPPSSTSSSSASSATVPGESTPKVVPGTMGSGSAASLAAGAAEENAPDPPLPNIENETPPSLPSLPNDIATLLSNLSAVFAAHPELSEGFRNIVQNAATGTYWASHINAAQHAGDNIAQAARNLDAEAGGKVADALGGIFRSFAPFAMPFEHGSHETTSQPEQEAPHTHWRGPGRRWGPWPRGGPFGNGPFGRGGPGHRGSWMHWHPGPPPPPGPGPHPHFHGPPPPPRGPGGPGGMRPPPPPGGPPFWGTEPWPVWTGPDRAAPPPSVRPRPSPHELRAQVDAAKLLYKAEKERYRQEREERKKEKEEKLRARQIIEDANLAQDIHQREAGQPKRQSVSAQPTVSQLVSNARGPYPQLEMVPVVGPGVRRHNTMPAQGNRHPGRRDLTEHISADTPAARSQARINRKLADMGFTENKHPELPTKIKQQMPADGAISKETEDDIVTTLLEELIVSSPKAPQASGSGLHSELPGAWN